MRWETRSEIDNVGFHLLRAVVADGVRAKAAEIALHDGLIPTAGSELSGAKYKFIDNTPHASGTYRYILEDVDLFGVVTRHPAIEVTIEGRQTNREMGRRLK